MSADYVLMDVEWVIYGSLGNLPETTCPKVKKLSLLLQSSIAQRLSARWSLMSSSCISVECCLALSPADNHSHREFRSAEPCHVQKTALHSISGCLPALAACIPFLYALGALLKRGERLWFDVNVPFGEEHRKTFYCQLFHRLWVCCPLENEVSLSKAERSTRVWLWMYFEGSLTRQFSRET